MTSFVDLGIPSCQTSHHCASDVAVAALHSLLPRGRGKASCNAIGQHADDSEADFDAVALGVDDQANESVRSHRRSRVGLVRHRVQSNGGRWRHGRREGASPLAAEAAARRAHRQRPRLVDEGDRCDEEAEAPQCKPRHSPRCRPHANAPCTQTRPRCAPGIALARVPANAASPCTDCAAVRGDRCA